MRKVCNPVAFVVRFQLTVIGGYCGIGITLESMWKSSQQARRIDRDPDIGPRHKPIRIVDRDRESLPSKFLEGKSDQTRTTGDDENGIGLSANTCPRHGPVRQSFHRGECRGVEHR